MTLETVDAATAPPPAGWSLPPGMTGRFAVVKLWPNVEVAEDEAIARMRRSARALGLTCIPITAHGRRIDAPGTTLRRDEVDFAIHLHFETPKAYDLFSFVALWNPYQMYHDYTEGDYGRFVANLLSHDDFLSCGADGPDDHLRRLIAHDPVHFPPLFYMFHSLSEPILDPTLGQRMLFYAGINWEKLRKEPSRHQALLRILDRSKRLRIYGPDLLFGVDVWEGYNSYVGPLPFDGVSVVHEIAAAGISLVLSSESHKQSGIMSMRLFESVAAGAVIICDEHGFARREFGDTLLYIDTADGANAAAQEVRKHLRWIDAHPNEATRMARAAQDIFREKFTLDKSLSSIYQGLDRRRDQLDRLVGAASATSVYVYLLLSQYDSATLERHIENIARQTHDNIVATMLIDSAVFTEFGDEISRCLQRAPRPIKARPIVLTIRDKQGRRITDRPFGPVIGELLTAVPAGAPVCIVGADETLYSDHIRTLAGLLDDGVGAVAASSVLRRRSVESTDVRLTEPMSIFGPPRFSPLGRFVFRAPADLEAIQPVLKYLHHKALPFVVASCGTAVTVSRTTMHAVEPQGDIADAAALKACVLEDQMIREYLPASVLERYPTSDGAAQASRPHADLDELRNAVRYALPRVAFDAVPLPAATRNWIVQRYRAFKGAR